MKSRIAVQDYNKRRNATPASVLVQHAAVHPGVDHSSHSNLASTLTESRFERDFNGIAVQSPATTAQLDTKQSCGFTPRTCPFGGACHTCPARLQTKLTINQPGDEYEQEADRVAEQVMRMKEPPADEEALVSSKPEENLIQRKCAECDDEDETLQRKEVSIRRAAEKDDLLGVPPIVHEVLHSPGQPLDSDTRTFFEPRLGHDFSQVRVHTGAMAAESAREVKALAYTVGQDMVFGAGMYSPTRAVGQKLLAHELTHVMQQAGNLLQRTPDSAALKEFDDRVAALRKLPAFIAAKTKPGTRKELEEILTEARKRDNALYYVGKLEVLFSTSEEKPEKQTAAFSAGVATVAAAELGRLATAEGTARAGAEEAVSKDPSRVWVTGKGEEGKVFLIDARDLTNIAVRVKVRLVPKGKGTKQDVANVRQLEDAIEKYSSTLGYNVDLEFVDKAGPDVFTVGVDPSDWPTSGNWISAAPGLAHELHHLLGLDDLYDYIEAHAENPYMKIPDRIHWFREQMKKAPEPEAGKSIMGKPTTGMRNLPSDVDVCRVAGQKNAAFDDCLKKRAEGRAIRLQPAISGAFGKAHRAYELLSGIKPLGPADDPALMGLKQRRATLMAQNIFGAPVSMAILKDTVSDMRTAPALPNLFPVSELSAQCSRIAFTVDFAPRIRLCPAFFALGSGAQTDLLLRESAHFVRVSDGTSDSPCPTKDCADPCGNLNNAEAWVKFVSCVSSI
jgi:hypothetical protein